MRYFGKIGLLLITFQTISQPRDLPTLDQFVGYYNVGVKPNKPFFKSRWYLRGDQLFVIYDSDVDRELKPYVDGKLSPTIFLSEEDVKITEPDSTYYLVLNFEKDRLESFRVIRPRSEWSNDLYGYRNEQLSEYAIDTEKDLTYSFKTDHFEFEYSALDTMLVPDAALALEQQFDSLIADFGIADFPTTSVRIYPDLETYHNSVLTHGAPKWQMGRVWDENEIRMLSTVVAEQMRSETVDPYEMILHEFVHCLHLSLIPETQRVPGWLWEGIATYKGCCKWTENPFDVEYMQKEKYPSIKQIESDRTFEMRYVLGAYLIAFIVDNYGWGSVISLIKTNGDIKRSLNISIKDFQKDFYDDLEEKYKR